MNTKRTPEPLLYIQQPEIDFPELVTQEIFMTKKIEGKCLSCNIGKSSNNSGHTESNDCNEPELRDFSVKAVREILTEAEAAVLGPMPQNDTDTDVLLESNSNGSRKNEGLEHQQKERVDLNYDQDALQDMIAQYEMKRQFEIEMEPLLAKKKHISLKKVKTFKEMDIDGKIEYLVHFPKLLPPVPCIFTTANRSIRGFLLSTIEREITIKTFDEKLLTIPIHELKDIQMIGMKEQS